MKKLLALAMALTLCLGLAACGGDTTDASTDDTAQTGETVTLKVGATPAPHQEILEQVVDNLAEQGITLEIVLHRLQHPQHRRGGRGERRQLLPAHHLHGELQR